MPENVLTSVRGFIIYPEQDKSISLVEFLNSHDFSREALQEVCRASGIKGSSADKKTLATIIASEAAIRPAIKSIIIQNLISPFREWCSIKQGSIRGRIPASDPTILLESIGEEKWYGPIRVSFDDCAWYIRPVFLSHWQPITSTNSDDAITYTPCMIRWLCLARIDEDFVSIHWRGLQHNQGDEEESSTAQRNSSVSTWKYIPQLFKELENLCDRELTAVNLHSLVLDNFWQEYRYNKENYTWHDLRLRAETAGVKVSARSSAAVTVIVDEELKGIKTLARTLRIAVLKEFQSEHSIDIKAPEHYDEIILRALIQDFGALSYEFVVEEKPSVKLMRSHCYFGLRPGETEDSFPHMRIYTKWGDYVEQLKFFLEHIRKANDNSDKFEQTELL